MTPAERRAESARHGNMEQAKLEQQRKMEQERKLEQERHAQHLNKKQDSTPGNAAKESNEVQRKQEQEQEQERLAEEKQSRHTEEEEAGANDATLAAEQAKRTVERFEHAYQDGAGEHDSDDDSITEGTLTMIRKRRLRDVNQFLNDAYICSSLSMRSTHTIPHEAAGRKHHIFDCLDRLVCHDFV